MGCTPPYGAPEKNISAFEFGRIGACWRPKCKVLGLGVGTKGIAYKHCPLGRTRVDMHFRTCTPKTLTKMAHPTPQCLQTQGGLPQEQDGAANKALSPIKPANLGNLVNLGKPSIIGVS